MTTVCLKKYREMFVKLVKPESDMIVDMLKNIETERDDLDLWLYTDDVEAVITNLKSALEKFEPMTCGDCMNGECDEH